MVKLNYEIDFLANDVCEGGATLLALLAYPLDNEDDEARSDLHASLCHLAMKGRYLNDEAENEQRPLVKPAYAFRDERQLEADLRALGRRLRHRTIAARMAIPYLKRAAGCLSPKWRPDLQPLSLDKLSMLARADRGEDKDNEGDDSNIETQIWRPSLPVIHLAAATETLAQSMDRQLGLDLDFTEILIHRPIIEHIVHEAQHYAEILKQDQTFPNRKKVLFVHLGIRQT